MANPVVNIDGKVVNVQDSVTIIGVITALIGPADENQTVTVQPPLSATTFNANVQDVFDTEGIVSGSASGNQVLVGNNCTVRGLVTAISGQGNTALLTVQLFNSGATVTRIPSGACHSDNV